MSPRDGWAPRIAGVLSGSERWCVLHAENEQVLPTLPDKSVAHVITDPPYDAEAHTFQRRLLRGTRPGKASRWKPGDKIEVRPIDFGALSESDRDFAGAQFARLAKRWVAVFSQVEATQRWARAVTHDGTRYVRTGIWVKPDAQPQLSGDRPGMGYESILFAHGVGRCRWNGGGRCAVFTHVKNVTGSQEKSPHPTTKPLALMLELVSLFTDPDEVVLDPFCGSGTTGVACLRLGRRFIGVERDAKYAALAQERLAAEAQGLTLRDARAGQQSLFGGM